MDVGSWVFCSFSRKGEVAILQRRRRLHVNQIVVEFASLLEEYFVAYRAPFPRLLSTNLKDIIIGSMN